MSFSNKHSEGYIQLVLMLCELSIFLSPALLNKNLEENLTYQELHYCVHNDFKITQSGNLDHDDNLSFNDLLLNSMFLC